MASSTDGSRPPAPPRRRSQPWSTVIPPVCAIRAPRYDRSVRPRCARSAADPPSRTCAAGAAAIRPDSSGQASCESFVTRGSSHGRRSATDPRTHRCDQVPCRHAVVRNDGTGPDGRWAVPLRRVFPWWYLIGAAATMVVLILLDPEGGQAVIALWGPTIGITVRDREKDAPGATGPGSPRRPSIVAVAALARTGVRSADRRVRSRHRPPARCTLRPPDVRHGAGGAEHPRQQRGRVRAAARHPPRAPSAEEDDRLSAGSSAARSAGA